MSNRARGGAGGKNAAVSNQSRDLPPNISRWPEDHCWVSNVFRMRRKAWIWALAVSSDASRVVAVTPVSINRSVAPTWRQLRVGSQRRRGILLRPRFARKQQRQRRVDTADDPPAASHGASERVITSTRCATPRARLPMKPIRCGCPCRGLAADAGRRPGTRASGSGH